MTTSGTSSFNLNLVEIIEEAYERCGSELRSGYDMRTARRSLNLLFADFANRGINMFTIEQGSINLTPGVATYPLPNDTVDLLEHVIRTQPGNAATQADLTITRISVSTYATIPNKLSQARPIQILINRNSGATYPVTSPYSPGQTASPSVTVWPVPDTAQPYTLVYWRLRRIQDAGNGVNDFDVPFRFLPCLVAGLAYYLALKVPEAYQRLPDLKAMYDEAWEVAATEDREKAAVRFVPRRQYVTSGG